MDVKNFKNVEMTGLIFSLKHYGLIKYNMFELLYTYLLVLICASAKCLLTKLG